MKLLATLSLVFLATAATAADTLHIYTWADYLNPALVKRFEKEHSCKVKIDTFDSNEAMYSRLKAGASGYDLIFPSSYIIPLMVSQDMLQPLDHEKIPNLKNVILFRHKDPFDQATSVRYSSHKRPPLTTSRNQNFSTGASSYSSG